MQRFNHSTILIRNRQRIKKVNLLRLKQIISASLAELEISGAELGINLVGTKEMARVNWQFLQHEGSTDVITFDHRECGVRSAERGVKIHGELFICVDEAVVQAKQFGTSWQSEVMRYVVHGVLHLLGHDDQHVLALRKMKRAENRLVRALSRRFSLAQIGRASKIGA